MGRSIVLLLGLVLFGLSSCMKDGDFSQNLDAATPGISGLAIFNAIPGSKSTTIAINGEQFNKTDESLSFGSYIKHQNVYAGERDLIIDNVTSTGTMERTSKKITLASTAAYSLFMYEDNGIQTILSKDNLILPRDGYAKIRVVHMVKDAAPLGVWNLSSSQLMFPKVSFKTITDFIEVKAGQALKLKIKPVEGKSELPEIDIEEGEVKSKAFYTLLIKGLVETSDMSKEIGISFIKF